MATIVSGGADVLDAIGGGQLSQGVRGWLSQSADAIISALPQQGQAFVAQWREANQVMNADMAMALLSTMQHKTDNAWNAHAIQLLDSLESFQAAGPGMQRFIMACPAVREPYLANSLAGYHDEYVNYYGDVIGEAHYDYRRVMDGVGQLVDGHYTKKQFHDLLKDGEIELNTQDKRTILKTWELLYGHLEANEGDPTCQYGGSL